MCNEIKESAKSEFKGYKQLAKTRSLKMHPHSRAREYRVANSITIYLIILYTAKMIVSNDRVYRKLRQRTSFHLRFQPLHFSSRYPTLLPIRFSERETFLIPLNNYLRPLNISIRTRITRCKKT